MKSNNFKKNILFIIVIVFLILIIPISYIILDNFSSANQFIFSRVINPYNPLENKRINSPLKVLKSQNDWKDPRGLFPIFAFNLPEKSKNLTRSLKIIEKGGINIIINGNWGLMPEPNKIKSAFEQLGSSNLMWLPILAADCRDDYIYGNENDETNKNIRKYLNNFNGSYVYGWYLWDEPGNNRKSCTPLNFIPNDDYADINTMAKQIRTDTIFNKKLDFVNLFPSYWSGTPTIEEYEQYINAFFSSQEYKPRVLCFDHYPFLKKDQGGFRIDFYSNLSIIRKKSLEYEVPFWMIVQSSEHLNYRKPSYEDISLQVYSALAYGATGIGYYLYSKCWEHVTYKSWILEEYVDDPTVIDSLHGPLYVPVQNLNKHIQVLGKILSELESVDIIHTSDYPNNQQDITQSVFKRKINNGFLKEIIISEDVYADPKFLIGVFKDKNNISNTGTYLLIVNKDLSAQSEIRINFNGLYKIYKFDKETGEKIFLANSQNIETVISIGSGDLFFIE